MNRRTSGGRVLNRTEIRHCDTVINTDIPSVSYNHCFTWFTMHSYASRLCTLRGNAVSFCVFGSPASQVSHPGRSNDGCRGVGFPGTENRPHDHAIGESPLGYLPSWPSTITALRGPWLALAGHNLCNRMLVAALFYPLFCLSTTDVILVPTCVLWPFVSFLLCLSTPSSIVTHNSSLSLPLPCTLLHAATITRHCLYPCPAHYCTIQSFAVLAHRQMTLASSAVDQISASRFGVYEELLQYLQGDTTWYVQRLNISGES